MATYRQAINRVLIALGDSENEVSGSATELTDSQHILVAQVINDILEQVEDATQWRALRTRDTVTISADANSGSLANSNERSRVWSAQIEQRGRIVPLVFDVTDTSDQKPLQYLELADLLRRDQSDSNASNGASPSHFSTSQTASGTDLYVWPRPTATVNVEADMIIPQSRLPHTSAAELDTAIKVPSLQVILGATWWLLEDRGEELGANTSWAQERYFDELAQQVARENAAQGLDQLVAT